MILLICISFGWDSVNHAQQAKAEGTLNIGAFLKNSEAMLVLWDSSYVERRASHPSFQVAVENIALFRTARELVRNSCNALHCFRGMCVC